MTYQETSRDVLKSISVRVQPMKEIVFDVISKYPLGIIMQDIEKELGMGRSTVSARVRGLVIDGRIRHNGEYGLTDSGCRAMQWVVA